MSKKHTGQCACGAVKFGFDTAPDFVAVCHCLDCKRASGGEAATFSGVPPTTSPWSAASRKLEHYIADAGKKLDCSFCATCGSRLFTNNLESFPGMVFVMLGNLDRPDVFQPKLEMFTKRRLKWAKPLDLPQFDSMPG